MLLVAPLDHSWVNYKLNFEAHIIVSYVVCQFKLLKLWHDYDDLNFFNELFI